MMWTLHLPRTLLAVTLGCWCFHLTQECITTDQCSEICEYSEWAKHAICGHRHLEVIPQVCCGVMSLDVRHNDIRILRQATLANFTNLRYLHLDSNNMSVVRKGAFHGCSKLEYLSLGGNDFRRMTRRMLEGLEKVRYLLMRRGNLKRIDQGALQETPSILTIDLQGNQLVSPPCDALPAGNVLKELFLSRNRISLIPRLCFHNFTKLERLQLNDNPIGAITNIDAFQGLESLKELSMRNTSLSAVPVAMFREIHTTDTLILSHNLITSLHERDFMGLPYLTTLKLEYNLITLIHKKAFSGLDFLEILVLSNNRIVSFGQDALLPAKGTLRDLHLNGNILHSIRNISSSLTSLNRLFIADNPLVCNCHLAPLRQWFRLNRAIISSTEGNATCRTSESDQNVVSILDSNQTYPCLQDTTSTIGAISLHEEEISTVKFEVSTDGSIADTNTNVPGMDMPRIFLITVGIMLAVLVVSMVALLVVCIRARRRAKLKEGSESDDNYATVTETPGEDIISRLHDSRIPYNPIYSTRIRLQDGQNDGFRGSSILSSSLPSPNPPGSPLCSNGSIGNVRHTNFDHPTYQGQTIQHDHSPYGSRNLSAGIDFDGGNERLDGKKVVITSKKDRTGTSDHDQMSFTSVDGVDDVVEENTGDGVDVCDSLVTETSFQDPLRGHRHNLLTKTNLNTNKRENDENDENSFPEEVLAGPVNALWTHVSTKEGLRKDHRKYVQQQNASHGMQSTHEEASCTNHKQLITTV